VFTRPLPVHAHEAELVDAVRRYPVVVVEGPTGCGKTTQIPQMLLRAGVTPLRIGVTQPRRIAAVSVAWRIAEERDAVLGGEVGYAIRFDDRTSDSTRVQVMTDGILLQAARHDPDFLRWGVLIIDEAHERTLNIDLLLGLLHDVLRRRPDLRVVVSSATLQPERFVQYFREVAGHVPVVRIDAKPFPVDVQWRPLDSDIPDAVADAIGREVAGIHRSGQPGHVLAFLPGEDAIKRAAAAVGRQKLKDVVVLPLYGALTREEQERVFEPFAGQRKVVLATNIAETSITIDDTRFVIDTGLAKVPRFSTRTGMTVLREEGISRASAEQRAGRAGRTAPGRCIRLYSREGFGHRPAFTDEEISRLDLSEVVLRLLDLGIRDLEAFAFPTPPSRGRIQAALVHLESLGAVDRQRRLTPVGRQMAPLPLPPPLARMVVEAVLRFPEVADDVIALAAVLSGRQPHALPAGRETDAQRAHAQFAHPLGDAVVAVKMLRGWQEARDRAAFCRRFFLDHNVLQFADHAYRQLRELMAEMGGELGAGGDPAGIVRALAAGHPGNVLVSRGRVFEAPSGERVLVHPSSSLFGTQARFLVACELVATARPYARQCSVLKPPWLAEVRPDLAGPWGAQGKVREPALPQATGPLRLGEVTLEVDARKGRPRVDIPASAIDALRGVTPADLPPGAAGWQARLLAGAHVFATGTPLGALLAVLPQLPLPGPEDDLRCTVPEGVLLELDRDGHALARHLPQLLAPMLPHHGKRPGWLCLVANGGGGYWFEVGMDWREVLETTLTSLEDLSRHLPDSDPLEVEAEAQLVRVRPRLEAVQEALRLARTARRG
jgi:HrpA-like RNA helicase